MCDSSVSKPQLTAVGGSSDISKEQLVLLGNSSSAALLFLLEHTMRSPSNQITPPVARRPLSHPRAFLLMSALWGQKVRVLPLKAH